MLCIRGQIVEISGSQVVLGFGGREQPTNQVVHVVSIGDGDIKLAVDSISGFVDAADGDFADPPRLGGKDAAMVCQSEHVISILDPDALFD